MGLFKKVLLMVFSIAIVFNVGFLPCAFAASPTTLEECCTELDKILSPQEKKQVQQCSVFCRGCYISDMVCGPLGRKIQYEWLYSPTGADGYGPSDRSVLAKLLLGHGAGFLSDTDYVMTSIILENYSHYLNGVVVPSIEDLIIDHWYDFCDHFKTKEEHRRMMEKYKKLIASRQESAVWSCVLM